MRNSILKLLSVSALFLTVSCGQGEEFEQGNGESNSELASLTGFPCESYGQNVADPNSFCSVVRTGGASTEVLYQFRGFTAPQVNKLKSALRMAGERFSAHWTSAQPSSLVQCITQRSTEGLDPIGSTLSTTFKDTKSKAIWALTTLNFGFTFHRDSKRPIIVTSYRNQAGAARAKVGNDALPTKVFLDFEVNTDNLDGKGLGNESTTVNFYAGAILHEMLHTRGYSHNGGGRRAGPLVYSVGDCISGYPAGLSLTTSSLPEL